MQYYSLVFSEDPPIDLRGLVKWFEGMNPRVRKVRSHKKRELPLVRTDVDDCLGLNFTHRGFVFDCSRDTTKERGSVARLTNETKHLTRSRNIANHAASRPALAVACRIRSR